MLFFGVSYAVSRQTQEIGSPGGQSPAGHRLGYE